MADDIVGIDLGTTNSEIAVYRDGRPEILADEPPFAVGLELDGLGLAGLAVAAVDSQVAPLEVLQPHDRGARVEAFRKPCVRRRAAI